MKARALFASVLAVTAVAFPAAAYSGTVSVVAVDTHKTYVEIDTSHDICSGAGSWNDRPRAYYSAGAIADSALRLATAALLSGKKLYIDADVVDGRCVINVVQLNAD